MNCFEARPRFVDLWRGTLDAEGRAALLAHLKRCAKCDRAFRTFALTAPMLHPRGTAADSHERAAEAMVTTDAPAESAHVVRLSAARQPRTDAARAAEIMRRAGVYRPTSRTSARNWRGVAGAVSMVAAAVLLAYVSVAGPPQSLSDALMATQQLTTPASTHFFGQPMPEIPNDLVG
jgi:hypothetical protein